ncbi:MULTISPECIES: hypothetical protein [unclassified Mesorhizobium]|uniref:hypothetical protein n=1 Tax=unclassified Mesorhizobium TaxID=325217 RepID=UPI001128BF22|nr:MULTISPECIES: hypothetical protein [unclassified Mesorhizobium]TPK96544.1 hypothetical protein FJ567_21025 [Mesorhizobium sp. B2-4-16]TPL62429.1 hypothetical protein FJ956_25100 [Mesorhizobium sp. B2-4-3]
MADEVASQIADVSDAELASVTQTLVFQPDVSADDRDRFFGQVQALVEDRARREWPGEDGSGISIFVRADYPRQAASALAGTKPSADMVGTDEPLMGRLFLLDRNASQGWSGDLPFADSGELIEWLTTLPFGSSQVILVYRSTSLMIERANGAQGGMTRKESIRAKLPPVTREGLLEALNHFHMHSVLTPQNCPDGLWRVGHAEAYHTGPTPEVSLQAQLRTFLTAWFRGQLHVDRETTTEIGRIDIALLIPPSDSSGGLTYWGVVELKVVKSFRYSKNGNAPVKVGLLTNARDVAKGVLQAHAFRTNRGCAYAVVEVYDMRADKKVDPREHAEVKKVLPTCSPTPDIRLTPLFGSAQQAREAGYFPPP